MTSPVDRLALVAQLDQFYDNSYWDPIIEAYPALAAAIRDGEARVAELALQRVVNQEQWEHLALLMAERDAAIARADAAEADADRRVEELDRLYHGGYLTDEQFEDAFRDHAAAVAMRGGEGTT